ncbi:MAG: TolC family protein [Myxococcota bacterium]|nr:TolC family protein [Myxococcota bacterium]
MIFLSLVFPVMSQELSFEEALSIASKKNNEIKLAELDVESSEGGILAARSMFDPQLSATVGQNVSTGQQFFAGFGLFKTEMSGLSWSSSLNSTLPSGTSISIDWNNNQTATKYQLEGAPIEQEVNPFDTGLSFSVNQSLLEGVIPSYNLRMLREAQSAQGISTITLEETRQRILASVAQRYWELYYYSKLVDIATQAVDIAQEERRVISAQIQEGNLAPIELDRVEAAYLNAQSALIDAENGRELAKESLQLMLNEPTTAPLVLTSTPPPLTDLSISEEEAIETARQNNLTLRSLRAALALAKMQEKNSRHTRLPTLTATARFSLNGWDEDFGNAIDEMISGELPGRYIGLNLNMPIGNLAAKGEILSQKVSTEKAILNVENMEISIEQQVRSQIRNIRSAQIKNQLAQINLKVAEKTLLADRSLRAAGRKTAKDLLSSIRAVDDAKTTYEKSISDYHLAWIELQRLMGNPIYSGKMP